MSGNHEALPCACVHHSPHECYFHRYAPMDDIQRAQFDMEMHATGDMCECECHDEYGEDYDPAEYL